MVELGGVEVGVGVVWEGFWLADVVFVNFGWCSSG